MKNPDNPGTNIIISKFLGENSLGAYGLTHPLYNLIEIVGGFVATGTVVMCSNLIGSGKAKAANDSFSAGFSFSLILGVAFALILFLFPQSGSSGNRACYQSQLFLFGGSALFSLPSEKNGISSALWPGRAKTVSFQWDPNALEQCRPPSSQLQF